MGPFQIVGMWFLAAIALSRELQDCSVDTTVFTVGTTEDAATLATALECSSGDFFVQWDGEVFVEETIRLSNATALNITGTAPGATADGRNIAQLFVVDEGSRLHLSGTTLAHGSASSDGGAIYVESSSVSFSGNTVFISNYAGYNGGAISSIRSNVSWDGDGVVFRNNSAGQAGGAITTVDSTLSWNGDGAEFSNNYAGQGGAIWVYSSTVTWDGDGTEFSNNSAGLHGGAIWVYNSSVSWYGDGAEFSSNSAGEEGGTMFLMASKVSWDGDDTKFSNNSAGGDSGAVLLFLSDISWDGDDTEFSNNYAGFDGGAIEVIASNVAWVGDSTEFSNNHAKLGSGGAIFAEDISTVSWNGPTSFISNVAGNGGGAMAMVDFGDEQTRFTDATFIENSAVNGGALYLYNSAAGFSFTNLSFQSNSASGAGGAFAMYAGTDHQPATLSRCNFSGNTANGAGGAVETLSGQQVFISCNFEGNSADAGGAMSLGGETDVLESSFLSNSASSRGLAIAVVGSANLTDLAFDGNELYCGVHSFREDTEQEDSTRRFDVVCLDCPPWDNCSGCSITRGNMTPACVAALEHTTAEEPGVTLETLNITGGYWRATNTSYKILACSNTDACRGGQTGAESYCTSGYEGPYCAVCEAGYAPSLGRTCTRCSSSRRQGFMAATIISALVAVSATVMVTKFLLSAELEDINIGWFHRRVPRALPVQALKIIVVVWQILTQFADVTSAAYPGVYGDFLSAIDVVNFDLGSTLAAGCLWSGMDFHDRLLVSTLGPLVVVALLAVTYRIAVRRNGLADSLAVAERIRHKHQTALLLLTFLVYSSVSSTVFQTFACETLDDGIEYLRADYRIHCTDAKHKAFQVYAGIMILVYPVGIPLLYAVLLYQHREVLFDAGADKTAAQPISSLWEPYRPERFFYEVVECGRRIMLTGVVVFIFPNDAAQIAITMLIAFFFSMVFEVLSPYKSEADTWLSRGGHVIVFLSMFDVLLSMVDVSDESELSQAIFAGVLVAGHVLMVLAIVGEVVAICCASRRKRIVDEVGSTPSPPEFRSRARSADNVAPSLSAPASWRSFMRQGSVSEIPGPIRSVSCPVGMVERL